jgi:hypothetical protein
MTKQKRGYSREFTPHGNTGTRRRYLLDAIPAGLWAASTAKAKRDGISMRALLLHLLTRWLAGEILVALPAPVDDVEAAS